MKRPCQATTKAGKPCRANRLNDGDFCLVHDEDARERAGFGGSQPGAGRPRVPRPTEVLRQKLEELVEPAVVALRDALDADRPVVVGNGPSATMELAPDHPTRLHAAREVFDRTAGRPKQTAEVTGADGQPLVPAGGLAAVVFDEALSREADALLARAAEAAGSSEPRRAGAGQ